VATEKWLRNEFGQLVECERGGIKFALPLNSHTSGFRAAILYYYNTITIQVAIGKRCISNMYTGL
jgi:hypothetical protein